MNDHQNAFNNSGDGAPQPARVSAMSPLLTLLVTLGIVAMVIALLLPQVRISRGPALRNSCLNNLKQIGLALDNYAAVHGAYPPAYTVDADGKPLHSWRTLILPYMELQPLYEQIDLTKPWDDPVNEKARNSVIEVYRCPSLREGDGDNRTTYLAVVTPDSVIRTTDSRRPQEIKDVASDVIMVIDADHDHAVPWMSPQDAGEQLILTAGNIAAQSHAGGMLALFADGHSRMLANEDDAPMRRALISVSEDDNDILTDDE